MNGQDKIGARDGYAEPPGRGFWLLLACCVPLIVLLALIALGVV